MSPSLFNLVIDPLLVELKSKNLIKLCVHGLFLGLFAHANDACTAATNADDTAEQIYTIDSLLKGMA